MQPRIATFKIPKLKLAFGKSPLQQMEAKVHVVDVILIVET